MSTRRPNPWEREARIRKALSLLAVIPYGLTREELADTAAVITAAGPEERAIVAAAAGVKPPSDETWALVVRQVQLRHAPGEQRRGVA